MNNLRNKFMLDQNIVFLNHGSFGATPKQVFKEYVAWQQKLERQPVKFLGRDFDDHMNASREILAAELHTNANNLVYIPNATHGVNIVALSLKLHPGDEILTTDHEYGACDYTWEFLCKKNGASYIRKAIPLPIADPQTVAQGFLTGITERTKVIFISHITSPTAIKLPVELICQVAREKGILTVVDGAHAFGQIDLDLGTLGADFYTSNCHKWAMSPKGAAFLYVRPEVQAMVDPMVVSWGFGIEDFSKTGSRFVDFFQWAGTKDPAAYLSVPSAISFSKNNNWQDIRNKSKQYLDRTIADVTSLPGFTSIYADNENYTQLASIQIPDTFDVAQLKTYLYEEHKVELPVLAWSDKKMIRVSIQGYNTEKDIDALVKGLKTALRFFNIFETKMVE